VAAVPSGLSLTPLIIITIIIIIIIIITFICRKGLKNTDLQRFTDPSIVDMSRSVEKCSEDVPGKHSNAELRITNSARYTVLHG
jgi:hypothetical protein